MLKLACAVVILLLGCVVFVAFAQEPDAPKNPEFKGKIARSYEESEEWWPDPVEPPGLPRRGARPAGPEEAPGRAGREASRPGP